MADPISITLALIPIAAGLAKAVKELGDYAQEVSFASEEVRLFHHEMNMFSNTIVCTSQVLDSVPSEAIEADTCRLGAKLVSSTKKLSHTLRKMLPHVEDLVQPNTIQKLIEIFRW